MLDLSEISIGSVKVSDRQDGDKMESLLGRSQDAVLVLERRRRRRRIFIIAAVSIAIAAIVLAVLVNRYINLEYNSYRVAKSISVKNSNTMQYLPYMGGVLKYSRDGVSAIDVDGKELWNGSYEMDHPEVDICGSSAVVADIGSKNLYIYTESDAGTEMTMDYPILQARISEQGVVAVMLEDKASNMIHIYDPYANENKLLVEIPTNVEEGYPVAMDLSSDGTNMAVSYACVANGTLESRAAFYDFTDVGKNTNCLVGAQEYTDRIIAEVRYLGDSRLALFSEKGFSIWTNFKKPVESMNKSFKSNIRSVFCDSEYVGVVLDNTKEEDKSTMNVYNLKGKKVMEREISNEYSHIAMSGSEIMLNTATDCIVYRVNGVCKWDCKLKNKILYFLPADGMNKYFLVKDSEIEYIALK